MDIQVREIDHTPLDIFVASPKPGRLPHRRPIVTVITDAETKPIIEYHVLSPTGHVMKLRLTI